MNECVVNVDVNVVNVVVVVVVVVVVEYGKFAHTTITSDLLSSRNAPRTPRIHYPLQIRPCCLRQLAVPVLPLQRTSCPHKTWSSHQVSNHGLKAAA